MEYDTAPVVKEEKMGRERRKRATQEGSSREESVRARKCVQESRHVECRHVASKKARPHSWTRFLARYIFGCYMVVLDGRCFTLDGRCLTAPCMLHAWLHHALHATCFTAPCMLHAWLRQPNCLGLSNLSFCLSVCPLVCIYVYVYICVYTYIYVCIHICKCRVYEKCRNNNRRDQTSKLRLDLERNRSACLKQLKDHLYLARYLHWIVWFQ